jgi:negative regulator of replication initiation
LSIAKLGSSASDAARRKMSMSSKRHTSKKIEYSGKTFSSIVEAEQLTGVSRYLLLKHGSLL